MQNSLNTYRGSFVIIGIAVLGDLRFMTDMGLWEQSGGRMRDRAVLNLSPSCTLPGNPKAEMISGPARQTICLSSLAFNNREESYIQYMDLLTPPPAKHPSSRPPTPTTPKTAVEEDSVRHHHRFRLGSFSKS